MKGLGQQLLIYPIIPHPLSFILYPLSFTLHPLLFILHPLKSILTNGDMAAKMRSQSRKL